MSLEFIVCLIIILIVIYSFFNKRENFAKSYFKCNEQYPKNLVNNAKSCPIECKYTVCDDNCRCSSSPTEINLNCGENFRKDKYRYNYNCPSNCPYTVCDDAGDCTCSSKKPVDNTMNNKKKVSLI